MKKLSSSASLQTSIASMATALMLAAVLMSPMLLSAQQKTAKQKTAQQKTPEQNTAQQNTAGRFTINGSFSGLPDSLRAGKVFMYYRQEGESRTDSALVRADQYLFTGTTAEPQLAYFQFKYADTAMARKNRGFAVPFFIEPGNMKIMTKGTLKETKLTGSASNLEFAKLSSQVETYDTLLTPLYAQYDSLGKARDKPGQARVEASIDSLDAVMREKIYAGYLQNNPRSPLALYALGQYAGYTIDANKVGPVFDALPAATRNSVSGKEFQAKLEIARLTSVGRTALDFTQNDTLGVPVSLSSFRGKYVLIDFWASWCGPCRAENPNVVAVFKKYNTRNFQVLGVSLDRAGQKEKWLKAIHDDQLAWTQVSDLQFWDNAVAKLYGIQSIPQNLLLDPQGKIIARDLRGDALEQKLAEVIGQGTP